MDGHYQLKKEPEEVEKQLAFLRNVVIVWKGVGLFSVANKKDINAKVVEHWKYYRMRQEVMFIFALIFKVSLIALGQGDRVHIIKGPYYGQQRA